MMVRSERNEKNMVYPVLIPAPSCIAACFPFFRGTFFITTLKMLTKYPPGPAICLLKGKPS